jgi:Xaa-Pro aminopeptidase
MPSPSQYLATRHRRVCEQLDALTIDALIVIHPPNVCYLSNHMGTAGILVLTSDAVHLLVDFRYTEAVRRRQDSDARCPGLRVWDVPASYDEALVGCLAELGIARAGFEASHLTVSRHDWLRRTIAARKLDIELRATERVVERARLVKDEYEQAVLREAAARLTEVADAAFAAVRRGEQERDVAAAIEMALRRAGFDRMAFETIVASGPHAALPHHRAGARRLEGGDLVVLDFGGVLDGYCCDLSRTVSVGPAGSDAARVYAAVREAQQAAIDAVRPGVTASDVDAAARAVLGSHGLGETFGHGTGHGLGLEVHEEPRLGRRRDEGPPPERLASGMVFTIEPGAYIAGWGGVRIEDDVLVTDQGCELLTAVTRELIAVGS